MPQMKRHDTYGFFHWAQLHYIGRARMTYSDAILAALARSGRAGREVSIAAVGHESAIRSIKRGMDVRASTLRALCEELGLELYVGPPRPKPADRGSHATIREREPPPAWVAQLMDDLRAEVRHLAARDRNAVRATQSEYWEESLTADLAWSVEPWESPGLRCIDCYEVQLTDGSGVPLDDTARVGYFAVHRMWLDRHRLDATQCAIVRMRGESMEPTLNDGSTILVNRAQRRRRSGRLFAVRTDEGLVVRRLRKDPDGDWLLVSDHPDWEPRPWPASAEILGQVRWATRTFV